VLRVCCVFVHTSFCVHSDLELGVQVQVLVLVPHVFNVLHVSKCIL
jgi:hypothetical protein